MVEKRNVQVVVKLIDKILELDLSLLNTQSEKVKDHPTLYVTDIGFMVTDITRILKKIASNRIILSNLPTTQYSQLLTTIRSLKNALEPISDLVKNGSLTSQHHSIINTLESLMVQLRTSGIYSMFSPSINIPKIETELLELKNKSIEVFEEAERNSETIRSLIPEATATSLSSALRNRAIDLQYSVYAWLFVLVVLMFGLGYFSYEYSGINSDGNEINALFWVKRTVVFLPLIYLVIFAIRQYGKNRKLLEIYRHKETIGLILPAYIEQAKNEETKNEILLRGTTMIFTLPENPESGIQGSEGIGTKEVKGLLDIQKSLTK